MAVNIKYFMFSYIQLEFQKKLHNQLSKGTSFQRKYVFFNGRKYNYTEIVDDPSNSKYPDALVVASGDINTINYDK